MGTLTRFIPLIILKYIQTSNNYFVLLKLIQWYVSILAQQGWKNKIKISKLKKQKRKPIEPQENAGRGAATCSICHQPYNNSNNNDNISF